MKPLVGVLIREGAVSANASLQGFYDDALLRANCETSTGFPPVPVVCSDALATWATQTGEKRIRLANVSPGEPSLDGYTKQWTSNCDEHTPPSEAGAPFDTEGQKVRQARKMVQRAEQMIEDAKVAKVVSKLRLQGYSTGRTGPVFAELRNELCGRDANLAGHL